MYTQEITRKHRAAFVLVLDQSTSMQQQVQFGRLTATKAEVVAYTSNALITELIDRCRRADGVRADRRSRDPVPVHDRERASKLDAAAADGHRDDHAGVAAVR